MGNSSLLDTTQIINGVAVLLSFFVGYRYAMKRHQINEDVGNDASGSTDKCYLGKGDAESLYSGLCNGYKMVLLVRNDLKMGKGKIAAQCSHGAVGAYQRAIRTIPRVVHAWENDGCAKIALKVESEREMLVLKRKAETNNLITCLIRDAGRTQIEPNSKTVLAIGPGKIEDIDAVTGHLKLL